MDVWVKLLPKHWVAVLLTTKQKPHTAGQAALAAKFKAAQLHCLGSIKTLHAW